MVRQNLVRIVKEGIGFSCPLSLLFSLSPFLTSPSIPPLHAFQFSGIPYLCISTPLISLPRTWHLLPDFKGSIGPWILHLNPELASVGCVKGSQEEWLPWKTTALGHGIQEGEPEFHSSAPVLTLPDSSKANTGPWHWKHLEQPCFCEAVITGCVLAMTP